MKTVTARELAEMPEGVIYTYFSPMIAEGLYRKGETLRRDDGSALDFYQSSLLPSCDFCSDPVPLMQVAEYEARWGMYDWDAQFLVYEDAEIHRVVEALTGALGLHTEKGNDLL